ncbi:MAG: aa3-type cytochrome c oxidase subunit IV [Alteraurantiacibacter sp.]
MDDAADIQSTHNKGPGPMANSQDLKSHEKTYGSFIGMLKWILPLIAVLTLFIVLIIS